MDSTIKLLDEEIREAELELLSTQSEIARWQAKHDEIQHQIKTLERIRSHITKPATMPRIAANENQENDVNPKKSKLPLIVEDFVRDNPGLRATDIVRQLLNNGVNAAASSIQSAISRMVQAGQLKSDNKRMWLPDQSQTEEVDTPCVIVPLQTENSILKVQ